MKSLSRVRLFATPWTVAYQPPGSMGFSRQEYWSGLPFPFPRDLPNPGIEPRSPALQIDGETVADFLFGGSKITTDGDCSHEIKRCFLLGRKVMTNVDSIFKIRDITLPTKVHLVKGQRRRWHPTPVLLPGESHGQRSLRGHSPWGCRARHD